MAKCKRLFQLMSIECHFTTSIQMLALGKNIAQFQFSTFVQLKIEFASRVVSNSGISWYMIVYGDNFRINPSKKVDSFFLHSD